LARNPLDPGNADATALRRFEQGAESLSDPTFVAATW